MRAIQTGNTFSLNDNSMQLHNVLPAKCYRVDFHQMKGFYLTLHDDIKVSEKVYGIHLEKVRKTLSSFKSFERSLGVILSGDKGIGKSLFSKALAQEALKEGYPVLIVNRYVPGIADFLNEVDQEVLVLFDEFDKSFPDRIGQAEMLTLFDGISQTRKLFIITCNDLTRLNSYLVNRPGRFHYHFRFEYPSSNEIREYLQDKLIEDHWKEIDKVIEFANRTSLNYDCLRAIAFEISLGLTFEEAIADLNIIQIDSRETFNLVLVLEDGTKLRTKNVRFNSFSDETHIFDVGTDKKEENDIYRISFTPCDARYNAEYGLHIPKEDLEGNMSHWLKGHYDAVDAEYKEGEAESEWAPVRRKYENLKPEMLILQRVISKGIHYNF